jgi:succinate dehydrogenase / fumarate reductase membrane anchor subunit
MFFTVFLFAYFLKSHVSFEQLTMLFSCPLMQGATFLALICIAWHAWIGLVIVLSDYVKPLFLRFACQSIILVVLFGYVIWGSFILWGK